MSTPLWQPDTNTIKHSYMQRFMREYNFSNYNAIYQWSIEKPARFWKAVAKFCDIKFSQNPSQIIKTNKNMRDTKWFVDAKLNFAENLLQRRDDHLALIYANENGERDQITYENLFSKTKQLALYLKSIGVEAGDRIAGFVTNRIETIIAMLATTSLGAVWTACSPEFGFDALQERFSQIEPKVLFVVKEHNYQGKTFNHSETIEQLTRTLPSVKEVIMIDDSGSPAFAEDDDTFFTQLPFDHPLYILYSSGTTGKPKCMVHGAGNTLIQHKKELMLHTDLHEDDTIFFFTTCSWMMWHWLISSLSVGGTIVLYDGSPVYPKKTALFDLIDEFDISIFGCGAKIFEMAAKENLTPQKTHQLKHLRTILSTGSPLLKKSFKYIYENVKQDVRVSSISGGSDIISCFALGNPLLPVYAEELQCRGLGMAVEIFNDDGKAVANEPGELVCSKPFPSQPIYFWNDADGHKYFDAYFNQFKNVWAHGDYAKLTDHNGIIILGRSDATLNPGGIRIGTADIYEQVLKVNDVLDCLAVGQQWKGDERIILFVKLKEDEKLTDDLIATIKKTIRENTTPHHVPKKIIQVTDIPKTVNNKTIEIAVKNLINGRPVKNMEALANPESLDQFKDISVLKEA